MKKLLLSLGACLGFVTNMVSQPIDRQALVERHTVRVEKFDTMASLSVGNGEFAFTVDATGLQTFPGMYEKGIPLGTQSQWGWHSFPNTGGYKLDEAMRSYDFHGRKILCSAQVKTPVHAKEAADYFRVSPHRLHLGIVGLELLKPDGTAIKPSDISNIHQELNVWKGEIHSTFTVLNQLVDVVTYCQQDDDVIAVEVRSALIQQGLLSINLRFPFPTGGHVDSGCDWKSPQKHTSVLENVTSGSALITRQLDETKYFVNLQWSGNAKIANKEAHYMVLSPDKTSDKFSFSCRFSASKQSSKVATFADVRTNSQMAWKNYWTTGGVVDFTGSTDARAHELERRIVLSQYLTRIQCAGSVPPQETGLTCNSWYGKFHLEMHWWHAAHFAMWNHDDLLQRSMGWYQNILPKAREIAQRQGFDGVRWPKMTDPTGVDCPSSIGSALIWEQPHIIYFAELCYRNSHDKAILEKYKNLVFETATFMASYAWYEKEKDRYILGPALIPAQECFDAATTINPPYELSYWYFGLKVAQQWRERLGMPRDKKWDDVLTKLSVLAQLKGLYLGSENVTDTYTNPRYTADHPAVLAAFGIMPGSRLVDTTTMNQTFNYIWKNWQWEDTWGWDFPMAAMCATRLGHPEKALDALFMPSIKNTYLVQGHNYQDARLRLYLPGNGGLLAAVAMMCAGYDGCTVKNPGFPKDGTWTVRWENLNALP
jgi:protein-glucosylgalactosylhydroxylysine glucosidase